MYEKLKEQNNDIPVWHSPCGGTSHIVGTAVHEEFGFVDPSKNDKPPFDGYSPLCASCRRLADIMRNRT